MAVYTDVSDEALEEFLGQYDLGDVLAFKGIAEGIENSNYVLQTKRGTYILTLYERRVEADDLPFFLGLMEHLAQNGIACPTPIQGRDGTALRELCGRPAAIVTSLNGMWVRRPTPRHCAQLGRAMARMHLAGDGFPITRTNTLGIHAWRPLFEACSSRTHEVHPDLGDEIAEELDFLESNWPAEVPGGIIHGDLFPDNVFFLGDTLSGLIDFYFACNDLYAYDLAVCLNAWCFETSGDLNITKTHRMIEAYRATRPLNREEVVALPVLARGAALRFLLTRLHDLLFPAEGIMVRRKDPLEYLHKVRFHRGLDGPGAYGLDR